MYFRYTGQINSPSGSQMYTENGQDASRGSDQVNYLYK